MMKNQKKLKNQTQKKKIKINKIDNKSCIIIILIIQ